MQTLEDDRRRGWGDTLSALLYNLEVPFNNHSKTNKQTTEWVRTEELYPGRDTFVFIRGT